MLRYCAVIATIVVSCAGGQAQETINADRYALIPLADGLLRVDKKTGEVSRCTDESGPLTCRLLPDERMAYETEIDRLTHRLERLEEKVAALEPAVGEEAVPSPDDGLPSDEEIDRFVDLADRVMRRFFGLVKEFKGEADPTEL